MLQGLVRQQYMGNTQGDNELNWQHSMKTSGTYQGLRRMATYVALQNSVCVKLTQRVKSEQGN
eukprot:1329817-Amphidinium_carterae.1